MKSQKKIQLRVLRAFVFIKFIGFNMRGNMADKRIFYCYGCPMTLNPPQRLSFYDLELDNDAKIVQHNPTITANVPANLQRFLYLVFTFLLLF